MVVLCESYHIIGVHTHESHGQLSMSVGITALEDSQAATKARNDRASKGRVLRRNSSASIEKASAKDARKVC